jgi:hypothetical protein
MRNELQEIIDKCNQYNTMKAGTISMAELHAILAFIGQRAYNINERCQELLEQDFFGTEGQMDPRGEDER